MRKIILILLIPIIGIFVGSCKKIAKEGAEGLSRQFAKKTLKEMLSSDIVAKNLYEQFQKYISKDFAESVVVNSTEEGLEYVSKNFPTSAIRRNGNTIVGKAGSLIDNGPVNEFFNHLLPNKTYKVDDIFLYKTDNLGRVVDCYADRTKAFSDLAGKRNPQRNKNVQKMVIDKLDGKSGVDDAGHLFSNTTGGPNELINQVPMNSDINRNGLWRQLERAEEEALKEGKKVISMRKLLYKGNSKRPYAIEFITEIDGVITKNLIENI